MQKMVGLDWFGLVDLVWFGFIGLVCHALVLCMARSVFYGISTKKACHQHEPQSHQPLEVESGVCFFWWTTHGT